MVSIRIAICIDLNFFSVLDIRRYLTGRKKK
jgi:hypothetical protein